MISRPTVFVLGAGASIPYDYPSGQKLVIKSLKIELTSRCISRCFAVEVGTYTVGGFLDGS